MRKLYAALVTVAALGLAAFGAQAQQYKWDLPNEYEQSSPSGQSDLAFKAALERLSGGKIAVTLHPGGALGYKSKDHFDAVADGAVPLADTYTGVFSGLDPIFTLSNMPFLTPGHDRAWELVQVIKPYVNKVFGKEGQMLLWVAPWTPTGLWTKKPVPNRAAIQKLKMRVYDPTGVTTFQAIGAAPIQLSWGDVIPQLTTGGIEAVLTSAEGGSNAKFWEHLNHFNDLGFSLGLNMTHMNKKVFDSLPPELQKATMAAADEAEKGGWAFARKRTADLAKILTDHGVTIVQPDPEFLKQLAEAAKPVLAEWKAKMGPEADNILAAYYKRVGM
jgi:TRAP-type C4-dicarboxylate transport system substrate-binding protein